MIENVKFEDVIPFEGLSALENLDIQLLKINIVKGTPEALFVDATISLINPSNVHILSNGFMEFQLFYHGTYIGTARSNGLDFKPGKNLWICAAKFEPKDMGFGSKASELGSAFAMGNLDIPIDVQGSKFSSNVPSLIPALEAVRIQALIPGMQEKLLKKARFQLNLVQALTNQTAYASFDIYNIFDESISILKLYVEFSYQGQKMGHVDQDLSESPIVMIPHQVVSSPRLLAHFLIGMSGFRGGLSLLGKGLLVEADCFLTAKVGDYPVHLTYRQEQIPVLLDNI